MEEHPQKDDFKRDILIYFSIIALTGLIIAISHLQLKELGIWLIVPIAVTEAAVLAFYFMHLMTKKKTVHLILLLTLITFITLLFWPAWDVAYSPRTPSEFTTY